MELIRTIWNLFLFLSVFTVPQLLGVLIYFRIIKYQRFLSHLVGFLISPAVFFYFSWLFWLYLPQKAQPPGGCGMAAAAAAFMVLLGTGFQTIVSLLIQLMLRGRRQAQVTSKRTG